MARRKETIWQSDFTLGAVRPEARDRDDTQLIGRSLKQAENTVTLTTGQVANRDGFANRKNTNGFKGYPVSIGLGNDFVVVPTPSGVEVYRDGVEIFNDAATDWTTVNGRSSTVPFADMKFWVEAYPEGSGILIGAQNVPIHALVYDGANFAFGPFDFGEDARGVPNVPFYRHVEGISLQPSRNKGTVTITASDPFFDAAMIGSVLRHVEGYIRITAVTNSTSATGTVIVALNRLIAITVADAGQAADMRPGDAVENDVTGAQGIVSSVTGAVVTITGIGNLGKWVTATDAKLVSPSAQSEITNIFADIDVGSSEDWALEMMNPFHGYAGTAAVHQGRLFLSNFAFSGTAFAASRTGFVNDFTAGVNDDDAFVDRILNTNGGEIRHLVSLGDLMFLTSRGLFYVQTRDGSAITPRPFRPIMLSPLGASNIPPAVVEDGLVFVDAGSKQIHAIALSGDVYRSWQTILLTEIAPHLLTSETVWLSSNYRGSSVPEAFVYATQADGRALVCQWNRSDNSVSWRPWSTNGRFESIFQAFNEIMAISTRPISTGTGRYLEQQVEGLFLDGARVMEKQVGDTGFIFSIHDNTGDFNGLPLDDPGYMVDLTPTVYFNGWIYEGYEVFFVFAPTLYGNMRKDGRNIEFPADELGFIQIGWPFTVTVEPWSRRSVSTQRGERDVKRLIDIYVTVQNSRAFTIDGQEFADYGSQDDLTKPPPVRNEQYRTGHRGGDHAEAVSIVKATPGPLLISRIGYRVTV